MSLAAWAADPVVFQYTFFIFAHNLMEAMALMVASAMYATLPLYLADGTRKLFSEKLANLALWILLVTSVTSGLHHFITFYPNQPAALSYWGNIMSWGTGMGAAISIFTVLATIWQHGLKPEPGIIAVLRRLGALHPRRRQRHRHLQHRLDLPAARHHVAERPLHDGHPGHVHDVDGRALSPLSGAHGPQARPGAGLPGMSR
jgi:hypothetical protein